MKPYSVVIVEDEKVVRLGLASYFSSADGDFSIDATFQNAMDAWNYLRDHAPDILLSDIKMPVMNGIDLIRLMKSEHPETRIIVLTSFADFEYAREAFAIGVDEYVLKHEVDKEQLFQILRRMMGATQSDQPESHETSATDPHSFVDFAVGYAEARQRGKPAEDEFLRTFRLRSPLRRILVAKLHQPLEYVHESRKLMDRVDRGFLFRIVESVLLSQAESLHTMAEVFHAPDGDLMLVFDVLDTADAVSAVDAQCRAIQRSVAKYFNVPPQMGLGDPAHVESLTRTAAEQASVAIEHAFAVLERPVRFNEWESAEGSVARPCFHPADSLESWEEALHDYLDSISGESQNGDQIRSPFSSAFSSLAASLMNEVPASLTDQLASLGAQVDEACRKLDSIHAATQFGTAILQELDAVRASAKKGRERLGNISSYIEEHFSSVHGLRDIANEFDLSASHLSREFRRRFGVTVTEKIHTCRVQEARRLIAFTSMSDKEIAFTVGYHNPNYFSRSFKKLVGMTATEYRASLERQTDAKLDVE